MLTWTAGRWTHRAEVGHAEGKGKGMSAHESSGLSGMQSAPGKHTSREGKSHVPGCALACCVHIYTHLRVCYGTLEALTVIVGRWW